VLYKDGTELPAVSKQYIDDTYTDGDYESVYKKIRENEKHSKEILLDFDKNYPDALKEENISSILEKAKQRRKQDRSER